MVIIPAAWLQGTTIQGKLYSQESCLKEKKNQDQYGFEIGHHRFLRFTHFAREPQCDKVFQLSQLNRNNDCSKTIAFRKSISLMIWRIRIQIDFRVSWSNNVTTGNCNIKLLFPVCCCNDSLQFCLTTSSEILNFYTVKGQ